ncbi:MAG: ABC transporter ATP-binding protein [Bacillota bacterium]|nr:ABC transporter ATP-binding protein [Bacillota bacterium]
MDVNAKNQSAGKCEYALEAIGITKRYGNDVLANDNVDFHLRKGEVHALLGENGAGKSTLVKTLYGLVSPDSGKILVKGREVELKNSAVAIENGIGMVHQELMLIPYMSVAENVTLGREITKTGGRLDIKKAEAEIREISNSYGFNIDPSVPVYKLPIGVQQRVEIIKLLYRHADVLILDEPTALLTPQESDLLFKVIENLKKQGNSIVFITHKLKEVYQIADRMTVMRGGKMITTTTPAETDQAKLAELMVGKSVEHMEKKKRKIGSKVILDVKNVSIKGKENRKALEDVSFEIKEGEILGVAGIEGNGQTQLAQAIIGLTHVNQGEIRLNGEQIENKKTRHIRDKKVGSIPDDRQRLGLILPFKIHENLALNSFDKAPYAKGHFWQRWDVIKENAEKLVKDFDIRTTSVNKQAGMLSGGNQQKVVVGRELSTPLNLLIASQPTRGVDFASAGSIQTKIVEAAESGTAVLLISSDLDELMAVSDRIMVLLRGRNVGTVEGSEATKEQLGQMMLGVSEDSGYQPATLVK